MLGPTTLSWLIFTHESFKKYVSSRVHEVQTLIPTFRWHHIDSSNNPADFSSRAVMLLALVHLPSYWNEQQLI